jgi:hypothetical protein
MADPDYRALYLEAVEALREVIRLYREFAEDEGAVYVLSDSEDGVPDGCGDCTPTRSCEDPQAGCYVHIPGYTDTEADDTPPGPPLYSGPNGDYTVNAADSPCAPDDVLPQRDGGSCCPPDEFCGSCR